MSNSSKWGVIVVLSFIGLMVFFCVLMVKKNLILDIVLKCILLLLILLAIKIFLGILNPHKKLKNSRIRRKKISQKFIQIYDYVKNEYGRELEVDRKKIIKTIIITTIILVVVLLFDIMCINILISNNANLDIKFIFFTFLIPLIYFGFQYSKYNKEYIKNYKEKIIRNFIEYINPRLEYRNHAEKGLMDTYLNAGFDDFNFRHFIADDYISGFNEDRTRIEISNITLGKANEKGDIKGYNTEQSFCEIYYEGIFSITELNYNLQNEIKIKRNKKIFKKRDNKVELDNREFEKYFDVYSDSEILAVGLIGHAIMEQMIIFYEEFKIDFEIIIKNNKIYMRFDTGMMFEPNILKKSYNKKTLWIYYNILIFVTNLTIKLNELSKDLNLEV